MRMPDEQQILLELPGSIVVNYWFQVFLFLSLPLIGVFVCSSTLFKLLFSHVDLSTCLVACLLQLSQCVCCCCFFYVHAFLCVCTPQSKKGHSSSSQREVTVVLPNGQYVVVRCDIKSRARDVFDMVVAHANLVEHFYFGLSFLDGKRTCQIGPNLSV